MNILHLTHTNPYSDNRILKEIDALTKTGLYNITCIGRESNKGGNPSNNEHIANLVALRLITDLPKWIPRAIRHTLMLIEFYVKLFIVSIKTKPNVIHCHDTLVLPIGLLIKKITKAKLVYDAHELESNKNGQTKFSSKAVLYIEKRAWPKIDHLITVSSSIIKWYEKNLGVKSNTLILNSPLFKKDNSVSTKYFHNIYNIPLDELVFVYLGGFSHGRGIDYIIEAFSKGNIESHIIFIGYGELKDYIKEFTLKYNNIHLHKPVPHEEVVTLVRNADVGLSLIENISLSDYFCLPNKLFEYSFAGLPVLASDFPDISKIVLKYKLGKVCNISSESINKAIKEFELNPPSRITDNLSELSWESQAEKLRNTYMILLNN